jgi:uracil-DNA glycosylase family 4
MSDSHTEAAHLAASLEAALRRSKGRGKRRAPSPTKEHAPPLPEIEQTSSTANATHVQGCELCDAEGESVTSVESPSTGILFVAEAPELPSGDSDEDAQDQFLTRVIENGIGVKRTDVAIFKLIKRAASKTHSPHEGEPVLCSSCLMNEISRLAPKVIVPLGEYAAKTLTQTPLPLERLRGRSHRVGGLTIAPTFSPAEVLQKEGTADFTHIKKLLWKDIQGAMSAAGITP